MRGIYVLAIGLGWGYLTKTFHWPLQVAVIATAMTIIFAFYISRVIEDDR
jgi:hypothetical protein